MPSSGCTPSARRSEPSVDISYVPSWKSWKPRCPLQSSSCLLRWPRPLVFSSGRQSLGLFCPFLIDKSLQIPLPDENFYLLLQVKAFRCVMAVIVVESAIFIPGPLARISFQLAGECQGPFVFDLHQDLINRGIQRGEVREPSCRGFEAFVLPFVSRSGHLSPPIWSGFLLSFSLLRLLLTSK